MKCNGSKILLIGVFAAFFLLICQILPVYADASEEGVEDLAAGSATAFAGDELEEADDPGEFDEFDDFGEFDEFNEFETAQAPAVFDPLSGYNRFMTGFNDHFYVLLFRPLAAGYRFVVWEPVRLAVDRAFTNAAYPVRFINNLLQLKFARAGIESARFFVNTTMGIGGLFDPAKDCMGMDAYPEDFGQTLGHYGVGGGFPVMVPFAGPSNLRDLIGYGPDIYLQLTTYIRDTETSLYIGAGERLNTLSLFIDEYDALRSEAIDLYVFQRDAYEMRRQKLIEE